METSEDRARKPGTHCPICGEPVRGEVHPGADVYHLECIMAATEHLREKK